MKADSIVIFWVGWAIAGVMIYSAKSTFQDKYWQNTDWGIKPSWSQVNWEMTWAVVVCPKNKVFRWIMLCTFKYIIGSFGMSTTVGAIIQKYKLKRSYFSPLKGKVFKQSDLSRHRKVSPMR